MRKRVINRLCVNPKRLVMRIGEKADFFLWKRICLNWQDM